MSVLSSVNDSTDNTINTNNAAPKSTADDLSSNFLTLLVAQLKNQDPTNPMDNAQLTSQLAQINTVSGIEKLNTTLGSISGQINSNQSVQATALIGHGVMIEGRAILVGSSDGKVSTTPFGLQLESAADTNNVVISDSTGKVVKTIALGSQTAGVHSYTWDGKQDDGTAAPDGAYTFSINSTNGGQQMVATALNYALVNGVTNDSSGAVLDLGVRGTTTLANVRQIL
ncbi:MAG: flagellar hook assembly protein FlgD [Ewingella americana]|jgi:flagellar basal-body rod modification protein FlgD|uniref:Basal-body rod modification protein FlgD n=2 Tax=Ewingella americana TaxID=41202 RepID=A0A085GFP8_EWIA3|nr:flagellar hook assembly protein FlgD [Ewingella americana]KAA8729554.1 flagellar hook assembly protein FlgD [Ewingella americana]KFC82543.1 FlgD family flagellar basal-body rod modification protein [Ewingella americana ATCC 33852]MCI1678719.1 flagellar hook assembly protein FlgD [Ewingella americana]MCI1854306.1 flagellar hook assembly protein FlgD [Ewingella americana]MCI1861606.1 flagellar hook assembly protein FlgD [Ewingella americana]